MEFSILQIKCCSSVCFFLEIKGTKGYHLYMLFEATGDPPRS